MNMTLDFNLDDRRLLSQCRLKRFRKLFLNPLGLCPLEFKRDRLFVYCSEAWMVDCLMNDLDYFAEAARIILGAHSISLCFAGEEIHETLTEPVADPRIPIAS